jgi:hypothetical protein
VTYQFNATYASSFVFTSPADYTFAQVYSTGWGQRTGTYTVDGVAQTSPYDGYFYSNASHTRLPPSGGIFTNSWVYGTATGTMSGTVSGTLGQPLIGNMTSTGTLHDGGTYNYYGPVTLYPDGHLEFYYEGTRATASGQPAGTTENGVANMYMGTYFIQTSEGSFRDVSDAPYNATVMKNAAPAGGGSPYLTGTQSQGFMAGSPFTVGFHFDKARTRLTAYELPDGAPTGFVFGDRYEYNGTFSSVVNEGVIGPVVNGVATGAMTTTFSGLNAQGQSFTYVLGGPVEYHSSLDALYGELYGGQLTSDGRQVNQYGQWMQSFDPNSYPFTQRYLGSIGNEARPLSATSTGLTSVGWGYRDSVSPGYYSGSIVEGTVSGGDPDSFDEGGSARTYMMFAGVTDAATGAATGTVFPMGYIVTGEGMPHFGRMVSSSSSPGSISIDADGNSSITLNNVALMTPELLAEPITFSTTLTTRPGTFYNIYAEGTMSVDPLGTHQSGLVTGGPFTIHPITGPIENYDPYFTYVMQADGPGDFSGYESGNYAFFVRGVLTDEGDGYMTGGMDIKAVNLSDWGLRRYAGAATRYPGGELVGDLIGVNRARFPDAPSSEATQTGTWIMGSTSVGTYSFTQTFNGAFYLNSEYPNQWANVSGTGWGQRTGDDIIPLGYFSATFGGYMALTSGSLGNSTSYFTFTSTMSGSVSGRFGHTLTGSMTWSGTLSTGQTFNYFGPLTITADGQLKFNYEGSIYQGETLVGGAGGELIQTPGTYFTQTTTAPASYGQTSYAPYNDSITYSTAEATVNRSTGPGAGAYRGSFINLHTANTIDVWGDSSGSGQPTQTNGTLTLTTEGVMHQSGDIWTGAQTTTAEVIGATTGNTMTSGGPVTYDPATGVTVAQNMGSIRMGNGDVQNWQGLWVQVPETSNLTTFTQTYFANGTMTPDATDPFKGTLSLSGWGFRNGVVPGDFYGTSTSAVTKWWGEGEVSPSDHEMVQMAMAGYVGDPDSSGNRTGFVWATGEVEANVRLNAWPTGGSATINTSGTANFSFMQNFRTPDEEGGADTTLNTTPGTFFYQKTSSVTENTSSIAPYRVLDISAEVAGSGTFPDMNDFTATINGTNTTFQDGVFPTGSQETSGHIYYTRGVMGPDNIGSMDLTRVNNVGTIARLRAQITLDPTTKELSGRLIGRNPEGLVPAIQRLDYLQRLATPVAASATTSPSTTTTPLNRTRR